VSHSERRPARQACFADPARALSAASRGALAARGVGRLFLHQARALDAVMAGARPSSPLTPVTCAPRVQGRVWRQACKRMLPF